MSTWPQCARRYDGTVAGFLTCVGESFRQKTYPFYFLPPGAEQITLYPLQEIPSDPALARAVYRALETAVSPAFRRMMTYGFLTCLPQRERSLFDLISASGCRRRLFSSTTKPTGRDCSTPGGSGRSAPWTGWTWTAPARRRPSARPSGGSSTPPSPSPSGTTPNCSRPTCPSGSGAT